MYIMLRLAFSSVWLSFVLLSADSQVLCGRLGEWHSDTHDDVTLAGRMCFEIVFVTIVYSSTR